MDLEKTNFSCKMFSTMFMTAPIPSEEKSVKLTVEVASDVPKVFSCDPTDLINPDQSRW